MRKKLLLACVLTAAFASLTTVDARDRPASAKDRASIDRALARIGCKVAGKVERDDRGFEVERARCGRRWYEITLDARYRIIKRERQDGMDD